MVAATSPPGVRASSSATASPATGFADRATTRPPSVSSSPS